MFNTLKKYITVGLLVILVPTLTVQAQDISFQDKASNLGQFLLLQFDVTDILQDFQADLLLNDNTCKQLDRFAALNSQSQITNTLLNQFESLNESQRNNLIQNYQNLEIEFQFLDEIEVLIGEGFLPGQQMHTFMIKQDIPSNLHQNVDALYPSLADKYESRIRKPDPQNPGQFLEGDYLNCPNSWSSVKQRADNISNEVEKIGREWDALKKAFSSLGSTTKDAVSPANLKSIFIDKPVEVVGQSIQGTIQNFQREYTKNAKQLNQISNNPIQLYQQIQKENKNLIDNRSDIAGLILSNNNLTQITETLSDRAQINQLLTSKVQQYSVNQITAQHFDIGLQANLNLVNKTPLLISHNKEVFKQTNQEGLLKLSKQVYDRQCVVNP